MSSLNWIEQTTNNIYIYMFNRFKLKYNEHKRKYYFFFILLETVSFFFFFHLVEECAIFDFCFEVNILFQLRDFNNGSTGRYTCHISITEDSRNNRLAHMFHISSISELRIFHLNDRVGINLIIWVWKIFVWGPTLQRVCSLFYIRYAAQIIWRKVKSTDFRPF